MTHREFEQPEETEAANQAEISEAQSYISRAAEPGDPSQENVDLEQPSSLKMAQAFDKNGLLNEELNGKTGEAIAKTVLENKPDLLLDSAGNPVEIKAVVEGQYDGVHGADLFAVDKNGRPYCVEVKAVNSGEAHLNEAGLKSFKGAHGETVMQMDDEWVKDRWRRMAFHDEEHLQKLLDAGVDEKYLDPEQMGDDSPLWKDILGTKVLVVVSPEGQEAVGGHVEGQCSSRNVQRIISVQTPGKDHR